MQIADMPLRVLIVEDSADDAELLARTLRKNGYAPECERVETADAMRAALKAKPWDIIFSDYVVPGFGGMEALKIARESARDLPFIIISGKVEEEALAEAMKAGATDFLVKGRLNRLGAVVKRELVDAAARRGTQRAEIEWRAAFDSIRDAIFFADGDLRVVRANLPYAALAQMPIQQVIGKHYWEAFPKLAGPLEGSRSSAASMDWVEEDVRLPDGRGFRVSIYPVLDEAGAFLYSLHVMHDVTERNRMKEAVEASERRFRSLIEHASDLVIVIDANGTIKYASPSLTKMGGYEVGEVLGRSIMEFTHPDDVPAAGRALSEMIADPHSAIASQLRFRRKDGVDLVLDSIAKNALEDPAIGGIVINARDVTERNRQRREIEFKNLILSTQSETSLDGILVVDENGKILSFNRKFVEMWGIEKDSIVSRHDEPVLRSVLEKVESPEEFLVRVKHLYEHKDEKSREEIALKDGRIFDRYSAPMTGPDGEYYGRVWYFRDITERKRAEQALRESKDLLGSVIEHAPVRVFWKGLDLRYLGCNSLFARDAGMSRPEELVGKDDFQMGWREQAEAYRADDQRVIDSDTPRLGIEEPQTTPDGRTIWLRTSKVPLHGPGGKSIGVLGVYEDVTERKQAERTIRQNEERFRRYFELGLVGMAITEPGKGFVEVNDSLCALLGYERSELMRTDWATLTHPDDLAADVDRFNRVIAGDLEGYSLDKRWIRKDGQIVDSVISVKCLRREDRSVEYFIAIILDITERKRMYREIERTINKLKRAVQSTIEVVSIIGEMRDPYTHGHEHRVGEIAMAIAAEMGLPEEQVEGVRVAGYLHDVGKIAVPAEILAKPSRLSEAEFSLVKQHAQQSYEILKGVEFPWPVAEAARSHHERLDGSGYPRGLKGDEIILEARIIAVADTVEAMSSHRPYRAGLGIDKALAEIERGRVTLFDPQVVDACLRLFREKNYQLPA